MKKLDLYTAVAAQAFGMPHGEVTDEQRYSIEKGMMEAAHRGPKSDLERMVIKLSCVATTEGPFGELLLTGTFEAVVAAVEQLRHEVKFLELGASEDEQSMLERLAIQSIVMSAIREVVT